MEFSKRITNAIDSLAFTPDSALLATGDYDGIISLWDALTVKPLRVIPGSNGEISSVTFSPDGKTVACGTWFTTFLPRVYLWDLASGKKKLELSGHSKTVTTVAFSPDGRILASGSEDSSIKLWNAATGRELATLQGSNAPVSSVMFGPDG